MELTASASTAASLGGDATLLFTDLEGSTRLWESEPEAMRAAIARHDELLRSAITKHGGVIFSTGGDGCCAAFTGAEAGLAGAVEAQAALIAEPWPTTSPLRARMALHTGPARDRDGSYSGRSLNRCSRILAVTHGGQIVCSHTTASLVDGSMPPDIRLLDLGVHQLRDLTTPDRLFQLVHPSLRSEFPPLRSLGSFPTNLPTQLTALVGRDDELRTLGESLRACRLVTLTGVGGVGKTRLAVQVGAELVPAYGDGVWIAELGGVADADAVEETTAAALGVQQQLGQSLGESLLGFLRAKRLLLILDNCEHLLEPTARLAESVLRTATGVTVLATSREPLGVPGERVVRVPSLSVPGDTADPSTVAEVDSVQLFVERARAARSGFALTAENAGAVAHLCRRLDGIPLAIELAAARVASMAPAEIAARLDQRFCLLTGGTRRLASRHQTLRRAIDWSYDLLAPAERELLGRLSVCAGGFDLAAAEAIGAGAGVDALDVDDLLSHLVDKSLVIAHDAGPVTRYRMLETIREYMLERLETTGDIDAVRARHAGHYASFAERAGAGLKGPTERAWLERVEDELDNLRAMVAWALDSGNPAPALGAVPALGLVGLRIEPAVGAWAEAIVACPEARKDRRYPVAVAFVAWMKLREAGGEAASHIAGEAVTLLDDTPGQPLVTCQVLRCTTAIDATVGRSPRERGDRVSEWLGAARLAGDRYEEALALNMLAVSTLFEGDPVGALLAAENGVAVARASGCPSAIAYCLYVVALSERDPIRALALLDEARVFAEEARNSYALSVLASLRGALLSKAGEHHGAAQAFLDTAREASRDGRRDQQANNLGYMASSLLAAGRPEPAAVLLGWVTRFFHSSYLPPSSVFWDAARPLEGLPTELGEDRYTVLTAMGAAMTDEEALRYAEQHAISDANATVTPPPP